MSLTSRTTLTPAKIDEGQGRYTLSAWFCTYRTDDDNSDLALTFLDASHAPVGDPVVVGGYDFVAALASGDNGRFSNVREWGQDLRTGPIPAGARDARLVIQSYSRSGAPDGYVDLVSLDVVDTGATTPVVASADPSDGAVGVGPVVDITVGLQDRTSKVNMNSIRFYLDDVLKSPSIEKVDTNTTVRYSAGLQPALTDHSYQIAFSDNGTPATTRTNRYQFRVADYLTLPASSASALGSEDATKPGFNVRLFRTRLLSRASPARWPPKRASFTKC